MTAPNLPPSDEVVKQAWIEALLIDEDWQDQYRANAGNLRAINETLTGTSDPDQVAELTSMKAIVLPKTLGSLALWANKKATLEERHDFEAKFGDRS